MSEYQPTLEAFLKDVETHQVEILLDQGVYRHLRCRRVEQPTWLQWFEIHTGPNFLLIRGDMGSVSFSRVEDMFKFFASDPAKINPYYWAEKIEGLDFCGSEQARVFDPDLFRQNLIDSLDGYSIDEARKAAVIEEIDNYITWSEDENEVRRQVEAFECGDFQFVDVFEVDGKTYRSRYIWLIRAICWAIGQYKQIKATAATTPVEEPGA